MRNIDAVRPDKRHRDLDNLLKSSSDLLQHIGIVENDSLCQQISARWVSAGEGITVTVEPA